MAPASTHSMALLRTAPFSVALALALGCGAGGDDGVCTGKCDSADEILEALDGLNDPVAEWLKEEGELTDKGRLVADYEDVLRGVAEGQGCDEDSIRTFIVADDLITGGEPFPRLISTVCSDDATKASEFFIAASFEKVGRFGDPSGEVDLQAIETFAWDSDARQYHFYATEPVGSDPKDGVRLEIQPARCRGCHLTPTDTAPEGMHMLPIMNELTRPWTHWNAEPGFPSHDYHPPERVKDSETFEKLVIPTLGSSSSLEEIIRAGQERVVLARLRTRRNGFAVGDAMALLRPLFCEEQINYVSEEFDSGVINNAAVVDPGVRAVLAASDLDESFAWIDETTLRLPEPGSTEPVHQVPVRGNADATYEQRLVALRALEPVDVLRIRAIDWKRPVFSAVRCQMWRDANAAFAKKEPDLEEVAKNVDALGQLVAAILQVDGESLVSDSGIVAVAEVAELADLTPVAEAIADETIGDADCADGVCAVDPLGFAELIDAEVERITTGTSSAVRKRLRAIRDARICEVTKIVAPADDRFDEDDLPIRFANRPSLPEVSCK